jgi:hypothetical protein
MTVSGSIAATIARLRVAIVKPARKLQATRAAFGCQQAQAPNQRARRLEPKRSFSAASSTDGAV